MSPACAATAVRRPAPGPAAEAPLRRADEAPLRLLGGSRLVRRRRLPRALGPTTLSILLHGVAVVVLTAVALAPAPRDGIGGNLSVVLTANLPELLEEETFEPEPIEFEELEVLELPELPVVYAVEPPLPPPPDEMLESLPELETRVSRFDLPVTVVSARTRPEPKPVVAPPPPPRPVRTRVLPRPPRPVAPRRPAVATGGRLRLLHQPLYYPESARRQGIQGVARVEMVIAADGTILRVRLVGSSGNLQLDQAALASARQWRFAPPNTMRRVVQPLRFSLR